MRLIGVHHTTASADTYTPTPDAATQLVRAVGTLPVPHLVRVRAATVCYALGTFWPLRRRSQPFSRPYGVVIGWPYFCCYVRGACGRLWAFCRSCCKCLRRHAKYPPCASSASSLSACPAYSMPTRTSARGGEEEAVGREQ